MPRSCAGTIADGTQAAGISEAEWLTIEDATEEVSFLDGMLAAKALGVPIVWLAFGEGSPA